MVPGLDKKLRFYALSHSAKKRRIKLAQSVSAEATSMGDVAFLLLIFFIVTTSFILRQGVFFTLPSKDAGIQKIDEKNIVKIYPSKSGYKINEAEMNKETLLKQLKSKAASNDETVAVVFMPVKLEYGRLVETLSVIKDSGVKKVSVKKTGLETEEENE
jgi:biopolymer transport protein ExbD